MSELAKAIRLECAYQRWKSGGYTGSRKRFLDTPDAKAMLLPDGEVGRLCEELRESDHRVTGQAPWGSRRVWIGLGHAWSFSIGGGPRGIGDPDPGCGRHYVCIDDDPPQCENCGFDVTPLVRRHVGFVETLDRRIAMRWKRKKASMRRWRERQRESQVGQLDMLEVAS